MPHAPPRLCSKCQEVVTGQHRCGTDARDNAYRRGYDKQWQKFRSWFLLTRLYTCHDCGGSANEVHHVKKVRDYPQLRLSEANCMALCKPCHQIRTQRGE